LRPVVAVDYLHGLQPDAMPILGVGEANQNAIAEKRW